MLLNWTLVGPVGFHDRSFDDPTSMLIDDDGNRRGIILQISNCLVHKRHVKGEKLCPAASCLYRLMPADKTNSDIVRPTTTTTKEKVDSVVRRRRRRMKKAGKNPTFSTQNITKTTKWTGQNQKKNRKRNLHNQSNILTAIQFLLSFKPSQSECQSFHSNLCWMIETFTMTHWIFYAIQILSNKRINFYWFNQP